MEYLIVLQVPGSSMRGRDEIAGIELSVAAAVRGLGRVDGHEEVAGETNILVLTDKPLEVFQRLRGIPEGWEVIPQLKAAYRNLDDGDFEVLDPHGPRRFKIAPALNTVTTSA